MSKKSVRDEQPILMGVGIIGGPHTVAPVEREPDITLRNWRVFEGESKHWEGRTRHFVGHNVYECEGRASTPIKSFDNEKMIGKTSSGRTYFLDGDSGFNMDAMYIWDCFVRVNSLTNVVDVTEEYGG